MKKSMILLGTISALSLMAISCQKEVSNVEKPSGKVHMTIIASGDTETKTVLQADGKTVLWDSEEQLAVLETVVGADETKTHYVTSSKGVSPDGGSTMTFDVEFDEAEGSSFTYNALYPSSSYVTNANTDPETLKVITPTTQKATATSFDGDADLLIAKPVTETSQQTKLNLCFKRMVVVGKMTLNNVQTEGFVKSVKFSSADKVITGKSKLNLTTGEAVEYGYDGTGNKVDYVEVTYAANDIAANGLTVYFTCLPFEIAAGEKFTVTLTTKDDKIFTREVTVPEGRKLSFAVGKNTKFSVDMTDASSSENESLAGKNYVIVARHYDSQAKKYTGNYAYMTSTLSSTSTKYYIYGSTEISATEEIDVSNSKVDFPDVTDYWTIETEGDNYAIKSVTTTKYISYGGSGNSAAQSDSPYELKISAVEDAPGLYKVSSVASSSRFLQYNGNSGQQRFAFYTGTLNDLYLIPVGDDYVPATLESITVSDVATTVFFIGDTFVFDGKVTATYDDESTKDVTTKATVTAPDMTTAGTKAVTVSYTEGGVTKTTTYDITVKAKPVIQIGDTVINCGSEESGFGYAYTINNSIDGNYQASCESDASWLVVREYTLLGTTSYQQIHLDANDGAERKGHLTFTYPHAEPVVITIIQEKAEGYTGPTTLYSENFGSVASNTDISDFSGWSWTGDNHPTGAWKISKNNLTGISVSTDKYEGASGESNLYSGATNASAVIVFGDISAYSDVVLSFGWANNAGGGKDRTMTVEVSGDGGTTWNEITFTTTSNATTNDGFHLFTYSVPSDLLSGFAVRFTNTANNTSRVDDVKLIGSK